MRSRILFPLALTSAALTACGPAGTDPGPGGVTVDEAKALDDAAAMLDERRPPTEVLPDEAASATGTKEPTGEN